MSLIVDNKCTIISVVNVLARNGKNDKYTKSGTGIELILLEQLLCMS